MNHVYIAGPMRGYKDFNFPSFMAAEVLLLEQGACEVFNPAARDIAKYGEETFTSAYGSTPAPMFSLREAFASDMEWLCLHATDIFMLDGWEDSEGANIEYDVARMLGINITYQTVDRYAEQPA